MDHETRRANNVAEFERLQGVIHNTPELVSAVNASITGTKLYKDAVPHVSGETIGRVRVFDANSFDVARPLVAEGYRVAVLNMASATSPGGGVAKGASAQEERLCCESTLYPCLKTDELWQNYYSFHRERKNSSYTDAVIYTPGVIVLRANGLPLTL
ncbi:MAG: TIGR02452 family protein [Oscillospiraceae bacterium]|jgi:uncharacterized protein (TIGR02452 family)|nr:TIGR02452 family protein [Oscillospiraceae bacterium]